MVCVLKCIGICNSGKHTVTKMNTDQGLELYWQMQEQESIKKYYTIALNAALL